MKITNPRTQQFLQEHRQKKFAQAKQNAQKQTVQPPQDKVEIKAKKTDLLKVAANNPSDPTVSTKVLDSLNTGMINFTQNQRDALATIMSEKSARVREEES